MPWCMLGINPTSSSFEFLAPENHPNRWTEKVHQNFYHSDSQGISFSIGTKRRASFQMFRVHLTLWGYTFSSCCSWDVLKSNGTTPMPTPRRKETWFMDYNGIMVVRDPPIRPYSISCFAFLTTYYINGMILQVWVYMVYIPIIRIQVMAWSSKWAP